MKALAVLAATMIVAAGCSAQGSGHDIVKTASGQTCNLDTAAICNAARNAPTTDAASGLTMDNQMRQNSSLSTIYVTVPYQVPGGSMVEVRCGFRGSDNSVVYAGLERGPQFTDRDVDLAKQNGLCIEQ